MKECNSIGKLISISDLSDLLNMKTKTIYAKAEAGEIPCYRIGRLIRFKQEEIEAWLDTCRNGKPNKHEKASRKRRASSKSNNHLSTIITKAIDHETGKYYSPDNEKSDRTGGLEKEAQ